jgi:chaperonin GroES
MSIPIIPLADYVVAKPKEKQTKTASGLYLPDAAVKELTLATVEAVGEDVKTLKAGDHIVYTKEYEATKITIKEVEYLLIKLENVIAKVRGK